MKCHLIKIIWGDTVKKKFDLKKFIAMTCVVIMALGIFDLSICSAMDNTKKVDKVSVNKATVKTVFGWGDSISKDRATKWLVTSAKQVSSTELGVGVKSIFSGKYLKNYQLLLNLKWTKTGETSELPYYGVYASYKDKNNYLAVIIDKNNKKLATIGVIKGQKLIRENIDLDKKLDYSKFHELKVIKSGNSFEIYFDKKMIQTRKVDLAEGQIGLLSDDTMAQYNNISVGDIPKAASTDPVWGDSLSGDKYDGKWKVLTENSVSQTELGFVGWRKMFYGLNQKDYTVTFKAKLIEQGTADAYPKYGAFACYKNGNNFVAVFIDPKYKKFATFGKIDGKDLQWMNGDNDANLDIDFTKDHEIKVVKLGKKFDFYLNNKLMITREFDIEEGHIAMVTGDTSAVFSDVAIWTNYTNAEDKKMGNWIVNSSNSVSQQDIGMAGWRRIYSGAPKKDYTVTYDSKMVEQGTTDPYPKYGIFPCYKDDKNFVGVFLDPKYKKFATFGVVDGKDMGWQNGDNDANLTIDFSQKHTIKVVKTGKKFEFYLDDKLMATREFDIEKGNIALITGDVKADFSDITVK